jgi:hypothetical protein
MIGGIKPIMYLNLELIASKSKSTKYLFSQISSENNFSYPGFGQAISIYAKKAKQSQN